MKNLLCVLASALLLYCSDEPPAVTTPPDTAFEWERSRIPADTLSLYPLAGEEARFAPVRSMVYWNDKLLVADMSGGDSLISVVDTRTGKLLRHLILVGDGPGELSLANDLTIFQDHFHVLEPNQYELYTCPIQKEQDIAWSPQYCKKFGFPEVFADAAFMINDKLWLTYYAGERTARFARLSWPDRSIDYLGDYPDEPTAKEQDTTFLGMMYTVKPVVKPSADRFALAYEYTDLLEIYDTTGLLLSSSRGPDGLTAQFRIGKGRARPIAGETRTTVTDVKVTEEEIWVLYAGELLFDEARNPNPNVNRSDEIHVYDWNGQLLRRYELNEPVYKIALVPERQRIFGISEFRDNAILVGEY